MLARLLCVPLLCCVATVAQSPVDSRPQRGPRGLDPEIFRVDAGTALHHDDGVLWGLGPDYKVAFGRELVAFHPLLGPRAPRNLPLAWASPSLHRDATKLASTRGVRPTPRVEGALVTYRHADFEERYRLTDAGVEQSFLVDRLPTGDGDLVVRMPLTTELVIEATVPGQHGVRFAAFDDVGQRLGGVRVGGVLAIDAGGRRMAGQVRSDGHSLELVIPRAFVATAELPLLIDPLIGSVLDVGGTTAAQGSPSLGYVQGPTSTTRGTVVVWQRQFSAFDIDVLGRRYDTAMTPMAGLFGIRSGTTLQSREPAIAPCAMQGYLVVAFTERTSRGLDTIVALTVTPASNTTGPAVQVVADSDPHHRPTVGGYTFHGAQDTLIVAWENLGQQRIEAARLNVHTDGTLLRFGRAVVSGSDTASHPAIARSSSSTERFLLAWRHDPGNTPTTVRGTRIDPTFAGLSVETLAAPRFGVDGLGVSGDGLHWVVSYGAVEQAAPRVTDVRARFVYENPTTGSLVLRGDEEVAGGLGSWQGEPAVALTGDEALVVYTADARSNRAVHATSIDWFSCAACRGDFLVESSASLDMLEPDVMTRSAESVLVWTARDAVGGTSAIHARRYANPDPQATFASCAQVVSRGHGTCSAAGNAGFHLRLTRSVPSSPAFLLVNRSSTPPIAALPCGSCTGILDPFTSIVVAAGSTNALGEADLPLAVPAQVSFPLFVQWLALGGATSNCPTLGIELSTIPFLTFD